ncbi:MAG TPA: TetR/AcrR family transcriptional regulator [Tepidisphaeraceae bacterium]|nr:TetR/AcrR family transcriptional regulator [Tepidisphaeraceae bacterium]
MGVQERRERERLELRQKIIDAARGIFADEGYDNVSMRRIADAIEYSPTAIYVHFRDKQDLFQQILRSDFDALAVEFRKLASIHDPVERIRASGLQYIRFAVEYPHHYKLMFMTPLAGEQKPLDADDLKKRGNPDIDSYAFLHTAVEAAMSAGRFRPELRDAQLITQVLWAGVHGIASLEIAMRCDKWIDWRPIEDRAALMVETCLRGLLADAKPPSRKGARS